MAKNRDNVTVEFDHHLPVADQDPDAKVDELRQKCPIGWSNRADGFWFLTKYDDAQSALVEWHTFCSENGGTSVPGYEIAPSIPLDLNPPEHKPYRQLLNPMLSKEEVAGKIQARVEYWTDHFIDQVISEGSCDLVHDVAIKVPGAVTLEWLGWARVEEEQDRVCESWHNLVSYPPDHPLIQKAYEDIAWLDERMIEELDDRERQPRDDRMTQIVEAEIDGERIPRDRAEGVLRVAISGGVDTTGTMIGLALEYLDRNRDDRQRLIDDPELWETATEEFLRRYGPVRTVGRTVAKDTVWGGCEMKEGERVLVGLRAANLDEDAFANPRDMVLDRKPNRHMTFGAGFHRCVGMHLARTQFKTVMKQILERLPDYQLKRAEIVPHMAEPQMAGWTTLPATFTPGPKKREIN